MLQVIRQRASIGVVLGVIAIGGGGCGDSGSEAAVEARIARERSDAARLARQDERIKQLERERSGRSSPARVRERVVTVPAPPAQQPAPPPAASRGGRVSGIIAQLGAYRSHSNADAEAARLRGRGIGARVLRSTEYRGLPSGYWIVFAGPFGSHDAATAVARRSGVPGAWARRVAPAA